MDRRVKEDTEEYSAKFSEDCQEVCKKVSEGRLLCQVIPGWGMGEYSVKLSHEGQ